MTEIPDDSPDALSTHAIDEVRAADESVEESATPDFVENASNDDPASFLNP